jgi:hypothetical protein
MCSTFYQNGLNYYRAIKFNFESDRTKKKQRRKITSWTMEETLAVKKGSNSKRSELSKIDVANLPNGDDYYVFRRGMRSYPFLHFLSRQTL